MDNIYVAKIYDENGDCWVYEGELKGRSIWTEKNNFHSKPKFLNEIEAIDIARQEVKEGQRYEIVRMF